VPQVTTEELVAGPRAVVSPRALIALVPPRSLIAVVAAAGALALAGLALGGFGAGGGSDDTRYGIGTDVPTSFGAIAIDGLGRRLDPSGKPGQMQAFVAVTNLSGGPVSYSPAQFRLLGGKDREPVPGLKASFRPGTLLADANFSGQLRYPVPRDGEKRWIEFREPAGGKPILIDLSRTGPRTPDSAFEKFTEG
jgi:hypothetical protein